MTQYKLKPGQERFQVVDGPYENRQYEPGMVYPDIPPEEAGRFDEVVIDPVVAPAAAKRTKADKAEEAEQ